MKVDDIDWSEQNIGSSEVQTGANAVIEQEFFSSLSDVQRVKTWATLNVEYIQTI